MHGGSQRMANVLIAIAQSKRSCPSAWMSDDLDAILDHGDAAYSDIRTRSQSSKSYLLASELPTSFPLDNVEFSVMQDTARSGQLLQSSETTDSSVEDISSELSMPLAAAIQTGLINNSFDYLSGCILILHVYSVALFYRCDTRHFYVFDPHSRNDAGTFSIAEPDGACVLTEVVDVTELCSFILDLCKSLNLRDDCQYELIPIGLCFSESPAVAAVVSEQPGDSRSCSETTATSGDADVKSPAMKSGTLSASSAYDIELYVSHRELISDDIKFTMLTQPWKPDVGYSFPYATFGKQRRCFSVDWLKKYSWMCYSHVLGGAFCKVCVFFGPELTGKGGHQKTGNLVSQPLQNWKDVHEISRSHSQCQYHESAVELADNFIRTHEAPAADIVHCLDSALCRKEQEARKALVPIVKTILLCGRQGLTLRGHTESQDILDESAVANNEGNFRAFLRFRIDAGDKCLERHLKQASKNAKYTSPRIQNELISCCGQLIVTDIAARVNAAKCFTVLADETTDSGRKEQLAVCVRYVHVDDYGKPQLREDFVGFADVSDDVTAAGIAATILIVLKSAGIDIRHCYGQGYDGASTMSGHLGGVQAIIRKECPLALYTHCASHCLNLALSHACSVPAVRNCLGTVTELVSFFSHSAKRTRILENVVAEMQANNTMASTRVKRLQHLCQTRWVERHASLLALKELFPAVVECLTDMQTESNAATSCSATSLLHSLTNSVTLVALAVVEHMASLLLPLTTALQSKSIDLVTCCREVDAVLSVLKDYRMSDSAFHRFFVSAQSLASCVGYELQVPRLTSRQKHTANTVCDEPDDNAAPASRRTETYFRVSIFNPFIDFLITELTDRFTRHRNNAFLLQAFVPYFCCNYDVTDLGPVFEMFGDVLPGGQSATEAEFILWKNKWNNVGTPNTEIFKPCNAFDAFEQCTVLYPNIKLLLQILCTLHVTTASPERTFSMLRRLKSWLRSTMADDRLTSLALLATSRDITISPMAVVEKFFLHSRRLVL